MNRLPNFFSERDSGPFLSVTHFTFCQREVILTRFEPYQRRQVMPLGRRQHASGQQGLVPGRAVTPFQVYTLGKWSPCSWVQTLLSVGTTAPSLPGAMHLRGSASPDLDCQSAPLFRGAWHWLFQCPRVHLSEHLCR